MIIFDYYIRNEDDVSIKSLGVKLAPAVEAAARPQLVEVGRLARKYWARGAVGDVVVGDLEGFY